MVDLTIESVITRVGSTLNTIIPLLLIGATVVFLWGIVRYLSAGGNEEQIKEGRQLSIWGVIFLAVMVAIWGLAFLLIDFVFNDPNPVPFIPGKDIIPTI